MDTENLLLLFLVVQQTFLLVIPQYLKIIRLILVLSANEVILARLVA